jgi:hypothetical protein
MAPGGRQRRLIGHGESRGNRGWHEGTALRGTAAGLRGTLHGLAASVSLPPDIGTAIATDTIPVHLRRSGRRRGRY